MRPLHAVIFVKPVSTQPCGIRGHLDYLAALLLCARNGPLKQQCPTSTTTASLVNHKLANLGHGVFMMKLPLDAQVYKPDNVILFEHKSEKWLSGKLPGKTLTERQSVKSSVLKLAHELVHRVGIDNSRRSNCHLRTP